MTHYRDWIPVTLKSLRISNGLTLKQLGERTDLSISYLSDLERGRTVPSIETLDRIFVALGTTLVLKVDDDYTPPGYVWVNRDQLIELGKLVSKLTPNQEMSDE